jgi:hypothetical protein
MISNILLDLPIQLKSPNELNLLIHENKTWHNLLFIIELLKKDISWKT